MSKNYFHGWLEILGKMAKSNFRAKPAAAAATLTAGKVVAVQKAHWSQIFFSCARLLARSFRALLTFLGLHGHWPRMLLLLTHGPRATQRLQSCSVISAVMARGTWHPWNSLLKAQAILWRQMLIKWCLRGSA